MPSYALHVTKYLVAGMAIVQCGVSAAIFSIFACLQVCTLCRSCDRTSLRIEQNNERPGVVQHGTEAQARGHVGTQIWYGARSSLHRFRKSDGASNVPRSASAHVSCPTHLSSRDVSAVPSSCAVFTAFHRVQKHMAAGLAYQATGNTVDNSIVQIISFCFM
jgi:hypothetical protein